MKLTFRKLDAVNKWLLILMGFFIPISTALTNVALILFLLFWMLDNISDRFQRWVSVLKTNPVALMGLVIFLIHLAGVFYSNGDNKRVTESLNDGAKFLFISVAMVYFQDRQFYSKYLFSFVFAMSITLILSYLLWMDMLPGFIHNKGGPQDCSIFLNHIAQNIFMAFMSFMAAVWSRTAIGCEKKLLWGIFSLMALFNVAFMVAGRTGHLIIGVLFLYYFISWGRVKGLMVAVVILLFLGMSAWLLPSNSFFLRAKTVIEEIKVWKYGKPAYTDSSSGLRLEFYINTLKIIKENMIFGTGTGSFEKTYKDSMKNIKMNPTNNPHNEYLMTTAQFGLVGLLAILIFFWFQWRNAKFFDDSQQTIISRGFVLTIVFAAMVSSPLLDHAEGWFFALMSAHLFAGAASGPGFWDKGKPLYP